MITNLLLFRKWPKLSESCFHMRMMSLASALQEIQSVSLVSNQPPTKEIKRFHYQKYQWASLKSRTISPPDRLLFDSLKTFIQYSPTTDRKWPNSLKVICCHPPFNSKQHLYQKQAFQHLSKAHLVLVQNQYHYSLLTKMYGKRLNVAPITYFANNIEILKNRKIEQVKRDHVILNACFDKRANEIIQPLATILQHKQIMLHVYNSSNLSQFRQNCVEIKPAFSFLEINKNTKAYISFSQQPDPYVIDAMIENTEIIAPYCAMLGYTTQSAISDIFKKTKSIYFSDKSELTEKEKEDKDKVLDCYFGKDQEKSFEKLTHPAQIYHDSRQIIEMMEALPDKMRIDRKKICRQIILKRFSQTQNSKLLEMYLGKAQLQKHQNKIKL